MILHFMEPLEILIDNSRKRVPVIFANAQIIKI
jgi:hypothetical protein